MEKETEKVLRWLVNNSDEYIERLKSVQLQDNVYTAQVCRKAIIQFLENPKMIDKV